MSNEGPITKEAETDDRSLAGVIFDWIQFSFDWPTKFLQLLNDARGMVLCYGSVAEEAAMRKLGIRTYMPMIEPETGNYFWQVTQADYMKAKKAGLVK